MKSKAMFLMNMYWAFSVIYYLIGKWQWNIPSYFFVFLYVAINYFALNIGYARKHQRFLNEKDAVINVTEAEYIANRKNVFCKYVKLWYIACILTIFFEIMWVKTFVGEFSIFDVFEKLGDNYYERMEAEFDSPVLVMQLRTLLWFVTYFVYPFGFYFFKDMKFSQKLLFLATVIVEILASLNVGVSKNIGDLVIIIIAVLVLKLLENSTYKKQVQRHLRIGKRKVLLMMFLILSIFLVSFAYTQILRDEVTNSIQNPYGYFANEREWSIFSLLFGDTALAHALDRMGIYCSHGYTGLAYALTLPFESTHGLGFSNALMQYCETYLGIPSPLEHTYNYRIFEIYGWKNGQWWSSAFVYIGSAITFWAVPILMYFAGKLFRRVEHEWTTQRSIISLIVYAQMFIAFVYLPCNAQIFQGRQALIATALMFLIYIIYTIRNNSKRKTKNELATS